MPRVSAAHEQEVRERIVAAAARGVRREGLPQRDDRRRRPRERPVGRGDLHATSRARTSCSVLTCDLISARGLDELADRLAPADDHRRTAGDRDPPTTSRRSTSTTARPGQVTLVQAWAEADRRARRPRDARRPARAPGRGGASCCCARASPAASCRPGWTSTAVARGVPGAARRPAAPAHRGRRGLPAGRLAAARRCAMLDAPARRRPPGGASGPGGRRDGVASRAMAHVQTVLGPIEPAALGFTLPHEHTQIALWHIPSRWDYWQLTRDEPVILEELARFRDAGGSGLVDLTLPGVGRDPAWLRGLATASGLHVVMGCGWYRGGLLPGRGAASTVGRSTTSPTSSSREATDGVGETGVRPGIIGEIGTDKPWVSAARGARPSRGRPGRPPDRAGRSRPTPSCRRSASTSCGSSRRRAPTRRGSSSATPTRTRSSTTTWRSSSAARTSSSTSSG